MDVTSYMLGKKNGGVTPTGEVDINSNGVHNVSGYATANVSVPSNVQTKTASITTNGTTTITPDTGYDGISSLDVTTNVEPDLSDYYTATINSGDSGTLEGGIIKSIKSIPGSLQCSTNMSYAFSHCINLTNIPLLDTSSVTNMHGMFFNCSSLTSIPLIDTSNTTDMGYMFVNCQSLTNIPLLNTSKVENMSYMLNGCSLLTTVPQLDTSRVTNFANMFSQSLQLSNDSLNNILAMCANATSYTGEKTLYKLGFRANYYLSSRIQALSNYQAFLDAGWTIGY